MKKTLLFAMAALLVSCGMNTSKEALINKVAEVPTEAVETAVKATTERDGYTFNTSFRKDENGQCDAIVLTCQKGEKSQQFVIELIWPKGMDFLGGAGNVEEEDINFDGIPDVLLYIGSFSIDSPLEYYAAFVWDEAGQSFKEVEGYTGIPNPIIDAKNKVIISKYMDLSDNVIEEVYGWVGGELVPITDGSEEGE